MSTMPATSESCFAFRENVRAELEARKISIAAAARDLEMSRPGLHRILEGQEGITLDRAERIANYLGKTLSQMLHKKKIRISA
jgi:plasmid maintenance system antidote protein VapI